MLTFEGINVKLNLRKVCLSGFALLAIFMMGGIFVSADVIMILQNAGVKVSPGIANALTTISGVYGVQSYVLTALGVTIAWPVAAAIAATGAAGV
ncbi:hypothetical protein [Bacillus zhangzhouensis]|uniref:hypothetical protein n=1 Tax=Bacillus zhangzhouensis TaxID=1178540 RepID=UPI000556F4D6|nr:hypothetical protein [Bacillus zhangzhouensis]